jgi:chemotaxis protein MotB
MRALSRAVPYITTLAVVVATFGGCASKSEYNAAVARGDSLQVANQQLQAQYDSLQNLFSEEMESASLEMELLRDGIEIEIPSDLLFESGSVNLHGEGREFGLKLVEYLRGNDYLVFVTGYTDSQNPMGNLAQSYPTNWELSSARSAMAVRYMIGEGLASSRFWAIGRAENDPLASNSTAEGREKNRRLRLVLRPSDILYSTP